MTKKPEMDLRDREELHRLIVRESPSPIFLVDVETRKVMDANPATGTLLRYTLEELQGLDLYNIDLAKRDEQDVLVTRVVERHHDILGERTFRRRDGSTVMVEASANLVIYQERQVLCVFARDISERKEAERERQRLQRQLALSQKHEAVGRLAAGIAHDFNNHLMVMLLCAQLVRSRLDLADESHGELEELAAAGNSASRLVRQLLAFSGKQRLRPRVVEFDQVLKGLEKMVRRTLGEDIDLVIDYGADGTTVRADPTQLEQVVLNLVVNARDAVQSRGRVSISTSPVDVGEDFVRDYVTLSPGPHVLLKVSDTGMGMDEATLSRIFEPFYTTKGVGKGTGLGLSTVYGIVKQSGGSIWASSEVGAGTTFWVYLPVTDQAGEEPDEGISIPEAEGEPRGTETLMVVEDEDMVRVITARILRDLGYSVVEMEDPLEALQALQEMRRRGIPLPAAVLTDVVMPGMSGWELVDALSAEMPEVKFIYMSGYPPRGPLQKAPERHLFLEKPLTRAALAHAIRRTLDT